MDMQAGTLTLKSTARDDLKFQNESFIKHIPNLSLLTSDPCPPALCCL